MEWGDWRDKKIFVKLRTGEVYTGIVDSYDEGFLCITDKFNEKVCFSVLEIIRIKEEKNG